MTKSLAFLLVPGLWQLAGAVQAQKLVPRTEPIRIGMVHSLVADTEGLQPTDFMGVPRKLAVMNKLLADLVRRHTGLESQLIVGGDYRRVARMVFHQQLEIGLLHGFEYAWVQREVPELKPLLIAIYRNRYPSAALVVRDDCKAKNPADLKGAALAVPAPSKGHCRLYLERLCQKLSAPSARAFFNIVERSNNVSAALDELLIGDVEAALVDGELLECYAKLKPGCHKRLRILAASEPFPAMVLVHRPGAIAAKSLAALRKGLTGAHKTIPGRNRMLMFRIGAFEPPPEDYQKRLSEVRQAYPPPEGKCNSAVGLGRLLGSLKKVLRRSWPVAAALLTQPFWQCMPRWTLTASDFRQPGSGHAAGK